MGKVKKKAKKAKKAKKVKKAKKAKGGLKKAAHTISAMRRHSPSSPSGKALNKLYDMERTAAKGLKAVAKDALQEVSVAKKVEAGAKKEAHEAKRLKKVLGASKPAKNTLGEGLGSLKREVEKV